MLNRRTFVISLAVASTFASAPAAMAYDYLPYAPQAFADAQKAGRTIMVEITASWCPICKAQKQVLAKLLPATAHKNLAVFEVDFDTQKDVVRALRAQSQSTLITFKGTEEVGRLVGETDPAAIKQLLDGTI